MKTKNGFWTMAILAAVSISLCVPATAQMSSRATVAEQQDGALSRRTPAARKSAIEEEVLPQDPGEREARLAKNRRFNGGQFDLTRSGAPYEYFEPPLVPAIPSKESEVVFIGELLKMQPYLSEDRSHIYTEITFRVEDLLKYAISATRPADGTLVIDHIGGAMKLRSGQILHDEAEMDIGGKPYVGGRYVVFAVEQRKRGALDVIKAYELREGKVFKLSGDGKPGSILLSVKTGWANSALSDESTFLQALAASNLADAP